MSVVVDSVQKKGVKGWVKNWRGGLLYSSPEPRSHSFAPPSERKQNPCQ